MMFDKIISFILPVRRVGHYLLEILLWSSIIVVIIIHQTSNSSVESNGAQGSSLRCSSKIVSINQRNIKYFSTPFDFEKNFLKRVWKSLIFPLRFPLEFGENNETFRDSRWDEAMVRPPKFTLPRLSLSWYVFVEYLSIGRDCKWLFKLKGNYKRRCVKWQGGIMKLRFLRKCTD